MSTLAALQRCFLDALPEVHRRNVEANLHGALAATYPVVRRLVGDVFFREAARRYAETRSPQSGDLNGYGAEFARFIEGYPPAAALPYLGDVARLEWACHEAEGAPDAPPFDFAALSAVPPAAQAHVVFTLHAATRLIGSRFRIAAIWHANQPDRDGTVADIDGIERVLVSRRANVVCVQALDEAEWRFLEALSRGATLEAATAPLEPAEAERVLGGSLARFVAGGAVAGFHLASAAG